MNSTIFIKSIALSLLWLMGFSIQAHSQDNQHIIWTENDAGSHSLNMRSKIGNQWKAPAFKIEESQNPIIGPTAYINPKGDAWVAWTELNGVNGRLRYRVKRNGRWAATGEITTNTSSDMAPSMIIDTEGVPWMVWSGTDETDDDIYFSRWIGNQWQAPQRVNENDGWPDILPSLSVDSQNRVRVSWQGYNGERYVQYAAYWTGQGWSPEQEMGELFILPQESTLELPKFIPEISQGYMLNGKSSAGRKFRKNGERID